MKNIILSFMLLVSIGFLGCKGKNGSQGAQGEQGLKGDPGTPGLPGPGQFVFINGNVTGDDFTVFDARINFAQQVSVYIGDSNALYQLPVYLPAKGYNSFYAIKQGSIQIFNAQMAAASKYLIELIIP